MGPRRRGEAFVSSLLFAITFAFPLGGVGGFQTGEPVAIMRSRTGHGYLIAIDRPAVSTALAAPPDLQSGICSWRDLQISLRLPSRLTIKWNGCAAFELRACHWLQFPSKARGQEIG